MKTLTKHENIREMEVVKLVAELYESSYRGRPTYGIKINNIVLKDIYGNKEPVEGLVKVINKMMAGNKKATNIISNMLCEATDAYSNDLINF